MSKQSLASQQVAIACENKAVPQKSRPQFIARGLWVTDFGTEYSFHDEHSPDPSRKPSEVFNRIAEATRNGGIGTIRAPGTDLIAIGRWGTAGIRLLNQVGGQNKKLKGLQFTEYGIVGPGDSAYEEVNSIADTMGGTVASLAEKDQERLVAILSDMRIRGQMRAIAR